MNANVQNAAEQFIDAMADLVAEKILGGIQNMMAIKIGGPPTRTPLGPRLQRLPAGGVRFAPGNGAGRLLPARKERSRSKTKPGAVTEAILGALQTAGAKGLKAREIRDRVVAKVPSVNPHTIGVMLSNLRGNGRVGSRGKRPHMSYFSKTGISMPVRTGMSAKPTKTK